MKKKNIKFIYLLFISIVFLCVVLSLMVTNRCIQSKVKKHVLDELEVTMKSQVFNVKHTLDLQYTCLYALANSIDSAEEFIARTQEGDALDAVVKANRFCMLGVADVDGNTVSYTGEHLGNIRERNYYQQIISGESSKEVEYIAHSTISGEKRILLSVPLVSEGKVTGVLYASKEQTVFEDALFPDMVLGTGKVAIITSQGEIIACDRNSRFDYTVDNIFDIYSETVLEGEYSEKSILLNMSTEKSGYFISNTNDTIEYTKYKPLGVNDWYIMTTIDYESAFNDCQNILSVVYIIIGIIIVIFGLVVTYIIWGAKKYIRQIKAEQENLQVLNKQMMIFTPGGMHRCYLENPIHMEYASNGLCRMLGYSRDEFNENIGASYTLAIYEEDRAKFRDFIKRLAAEPGIETIEYRMNRKNGELIYVSDTMESALNGNGVMIGYSSVTDITKFHMEKDDLKKQADIDAHTGVKNKSCCERIFSDNEIIKSPTCCIMFDLNGLKQINDTLGHACGDVMIKDFARILKDVFPQGSFIGRYGGDEFVVILYNRTEKYVENILKDMEKEISKYNKDIREIQLSCSYGYAFSMDYENYTLKQLLEKADEKMYKNKFEYKKKNHIKPDERG